MKYINTKKLENLKINKENTYIVIDFDKTITSYNSDDSWGIAKGQLGEEISEKMNKLHDKYRPIELDYTIPLKEKTEAMVKWYESCMALYHKYNLTQDKLIESVKKGNLIFRQGAKDFLNKANKEKIPIIIMSAGIANVIKEFLILQNCYFENIYIIGNFIEFDKDGLAKEFDNSLMIHTLNKSIKGKLSKEQIEKLKNRKYKILIGDLKEDEDMIDKSEWDTTLKIGILDNQNDILLKVYNDAFDIVLTEKDACFKEVEKILGI